MHVAHTACLLLASCLVLAGAPLRARGASECDLSGPVSLLILQSGVRVHEFARSVRGADVIARDSSTVIFGDGRVVTSDVESATRHLNALGWGGRPIEIVASFRLRPARRRSFG